MRLLLDMIEHKETEQQRVLLPVHLVKRDSSVSHFERPV
jgi:DNA-binding LacI/PurR family transcriptional regulator